EQLRRELEASRGSASAPETSSSTNTAGEAAQGQATPGQATPGQATPGQATLEDRVASLEESSQLLNSKVNDQYQTKIEAASKYRVRLSGIVLFNMFSNHGNVDNQDFPTWAIPPNSSASGQTLGASLRQSEIGLEVFGPQLAGP